MNPVSLLELAGGLALLILGAHLLVKGVTVLAEALGVPAFVIGLSVAAFGTSMPETVVSAHSALAGHGDIALGNVLGSNIFNALFILGVVAFIAPLRVTREMVRVDVPVMIFLSAAVLLLGLDGTITRHEGILLLLGLFAYVLHLMHQGMTSEDEGDGSDREKGFLKVWLPGILFSGGGLACLIYGADWFVDGAAAMARAVGVSERVIGLVIVGPGTSLPELATSILAATKGKMDIAVGNVVGSNIFNILAVLGITGVLSPHGIPLERSTLELDLPMTIASATVVLPIMFAGRRGSRLLEGFFFIAFYIAYAAFLVISSRWGDPAEASAQAGIAFVTPAALFVIAAALVHGFRMKKEARAG